MYGSHYGITLELVLENYMIIIQKIVSIKSDLLPEIVHTLRRQDNWMELF